MQSVIPADVSARNGVSVTPVMLGLSFSTWKRDLNSGACFAPAEVFAKPSSSAPVWWHQLCHHWRCVTEDATGSWGMPCSWSSSWRMVRMLHGKARDEAAFPCWQGSCVGTSTFTLRNAAQTAGNQRQKNLQSLKSAGDVWKTRQYQTRKREKGEIQLWPLIEKTSTALTQLKWQWNQRCGLQGLSSLAIKKPNCSLVRADQYTRWQRVSQSKCRAVSHPPQRALSLDKSQRDSSGSKKECRKGQRQ